MGQDLSKEHPVRERHLVHFRKGPIENSTVGKTHVLENNVRNV